MSRLPTPGSDDNTWGDVLNDFLMVAHNVDGTDKLAGTIAAKYDKPGSGIPSNDLSVSVQSSLGKADSALQTAPVTSVNGQTGAVTVTSSGSVSDASSSVKGIVQLAGDLSGTAASPAIAAGAITGAKIASATISDNNVAANAAIARTKLDGSTQTSLGRADTALQTAPVSSVAGKTGTVVLTEADITNLTNDLANKASKTLSNGSVVGVSRVAANATLAQAQIAADATVSSLTVELRQNGTSFKTISLTNTNNTVSSFTQAVTAGDVISAVVTAGSYAGMVSVDLVTQ